MPVKIGLYAVSLMLNNDILEAQVALYHQQRVSHWIRTLFLIPTVLILIFGELQLSTYYHYTKTDRKHLQLSMNHKALAKKWGAFKKAAKQLKALTHEQELLYQNRFHDFLTTLSKAIPPATLLTSLAFKAPSSIRLTGYASSTQELAQFLINLTVTDESMSLKHSRQEAPGVYFEIERI